MAVPLRRTVTLPAALVAVVAGALVLAGCTGSGAGGSSSGSSAMSAGPAQAAPAVRAAAGSAGAAGVADSKASALDTLDVQPRIVRTADVVVQVEGELATAAAKVRAVAQSLGGSVGSETTSYADTGQTVTTGDAASTPNRSDAGASQPPLTSARPGESVLVLRVPEPDLDRALTLITGPTGVGKELSRSATAQDVTADLADLRSRVATEQASVARVRALLARASSLQEVVTIEGELTKRESDLEAAEARQAALADRADLATVTVDLRTPEIVPAAPAGTNAFVDGLSSGWHAVTASTAVVLTVLGALLPVAVVVAVIGAPVLWWLRRRRHPAVAPLAAPDPGV